MICLCVFLELNSFSKLKSNELFDWWRKSNGYVMGCMSWGVCRCPYVIIESGVSHLAGYAYVIYEELIFIEIVVSESSISFTQGPVIGEFPPQRPVTRSFDVFFDLRLNKRLSKQSGDWWFETPSCSLWRHSNGSILLCNKQTQRPYMINMSNMTKWLLS